MFCSCVGCNKSNSEQSTTDSVLVVENVIKSDNDSMIARGNSYVWYETMILLENYLDEENTGSLAEVVNIYQAFDSIKGDPVVYKFQHFPDKIYNSPDSVNSFWIEDYTLADSLIKVSYDSAYSIVMKVNLPKPHSKHVCLRNPMGPIECNPQWVFGNIESQLWVDAFDGSVRTSNPAFPENFQFLSNHIY